MQSTISVSSLSAIAGKYRALLCDAWGVIHDGLHLFAGVREALECFRRLHGPVAIVTNAPRPRREVMAQLEKIGLAPAAYDYLLTSGDLCFTLLQAHAYKRVFRLGPAKDDALFAEMNVDFVPLAQAQAILCTGLLHDRHESPEAYASLLAKGVKAGLPMLCVNPDVTVRFGSRTLYCAGALAQLYTDLGGEVIYCGKPYPATYAHVMAWFKKRVPDITAAQVLCIGDNRNTDIKGANGAGMDSVFVDSGIGSIAQTNPEAAELQPRYAMPNLSW